MGNFKPMAMRTTAGGRAHREKSILKGSVGAGGDNLPDDLRLVVRALAEAGLLASDASHEDMKHTIHLAVRHIQRTTAEGPPGSSDAVNLIPASDIEFAMRRALAELRFPTAHRAVALSASPKGARAVLETGISLAQKKLHENFQADDTPSAFRRAILPALSPNAYQNNRRVAEAISQIDIEGLDDLISERIRLTGKAGFVEVRDFFSVLRSSNPEGAKILGAKVKRRLRGKPRLRFIKLLQNVPPNEDDFIDGFS